MSRTTTSDLLERRDETTAMATAIDQVCEAAGRLVLIEGPAGIGKSALLAHAGELATEAGMDVLVARGHELEHEFAFGVARQLFEPRLKRLDDDQQDQMFEGAAGLIRPLLGLGRRRQGDRALRVDGRAAAEAAFAVSHGFYWLAANLTEAGPLALLIDDAQWADRSSLQFIAYLVARCSELPLLVVVTVRTGESGSDDPLLVALRATAGATILTPQALSVDAVRQAVTARFGSAAVEFCDACARVSAGSPFLLGELLAQLESDAIRATAADVARVEAVNPRTVSQAVLARLERLGQDATDLARAVAILEQAKLYEAAALAGLDADSAATAADKLLSAGILTAEPLVYVHPLLRLAVYEQISPAQRAAAHRRAALRLAGFGAPATVVGSHLLRASPSGDAEVVTQLRAAAGEAAAAGDLAAATTLMRRALDEPPSPDERGTVLAELGRLEALAHNPDAVEHLSAALKLVEDPGRKVAVACALGELLVWGGGQAVAAHEMLSAVLEELGERLAPELRAPLETIRVATASIDRRLASKVGPRMGELRVLADAAGEAGRALKVFDACWQAQIGAIDDGWRSRLDQALGDGALVAAETGGAPIVVYATIVLVLSDEVERAKSLLAAVREDARSRSSIISHAVDVTWSAFLQMRLGDLRAAASDAQAALSLARRAEASWLELWIVACMTETLRERGEIEAASELIEAAPLEHLVTTSPGLHALMARARVRLAREDRERGIADLRLIAENTIINNPNFVAWAPVLATALASSDPEEARELAQTATARARALGQPRGIGLALRAAGRVAGGDAGIALLRESVTVLEDSPARLELAHSLADLGAALRRAGLRAQAREPLREAVSLADALGAGALAMTAREELIISGAKPRRVDLQGPDALTPSERRVAELAGAGLQNREIAQALFVTTKTVGTHLTHIYQKLDLSGPRAREQLSEFLT